MELSRLQRESISWNPSVDASLCIGDQECVNFCKNDVFAWDEENALPIVKDPLRCVLGCTACAQICPVEAITFPSKDDLRKSLRRLRQEMPTGLAADRARNDERNSK